MTKPKDPKDYKRMGRPPWEYDEILGNEICEAIATSVDGLRKLCERNSHWPKVDVIYKWVIQIPKFADKYAHARELQQEVRVNYAFEHSQDNTNDMYLDEKGVMRPNMAAIARAKLVTDTIKWEAGRLSRKYREKQIQEQHTYTHEQSLADLDKSGA